MNKKILIIDDSRFMRTHTRMILEAADFEIVEAETGNRGLEMVRAEKPDLVLLDVVLPDIDGFEVCRALRADESNNLMPILLLTSVDDQEDKMAGLELGADDYITKPFHERELLSRIQNTLRRIDRNRSANPLTGLPGNAEIQRDINSRIAKGTPFAVIYADLDNFKSFNDIYSFAKGDLAIKMTADILARHLALWGNREDFIGHIGGDDFTLITTPDKAEAICREIILEFDEKIRTLYTEEDAARGHIQAVNRKGELETYPIISITLAVAAYRDEMPASHFDVADAAAEVKRRLKSLSGSHYQSVDRSPV